MAAMDVAFRTVADDDEVLEPVELPVSGSLPADVGGVLRRVVPARFERGGRRYAHWFDGDGLLQELIIDGLRGTVAYRDRFVDTAGRRAEAAAGRRIYSGGFWGPPPGGPLNRLRHWRPKNVANINVLAHGDDLWVLWEGGRPHRIDPVTLATVGEDDLDGVLRRDSDAFAAHPHADPDTGEPWNFGVRFGASPSLSLYRLAAGGWRRVTEVPIPPRMVHDFGLTPRYAVFVLPPYRLPFVPLGLVTGAKGYGDSLRWRPSQGTTVLAIDRAAPDRPPRTWMLPPLFAFHVIGAAEHDDDLVVHLCAYDDAAVVGDLRLSSLLAPHPPAPARSRPVRIRLGAGGGADVTTVADIDFDLPRARTDQLALGLSASGADLPVLDQIVALDVSTGAIQRAAATGPGRIAGEPVPLTTGSGGPARWAASIELDTVAERSQLVVHDLDAGLAPVARAILPHVVPLGLHGHWSPTIG